MATEHLWQKASSFAAQAHQHQIRKDERTPYFAHPARVAMIVANVFGVTDEAIIAAAFLHDTIEDCDVDYDDLLEEFGSDVADYVACLSKDMRLVEHDREPAYDRQLAQGPWQARMIKLADVYDNLIDAVDKDSQRSLLARTRRALALAEHDPELEKAREIVSALAGEVERVVK